MTLFRHLFYPDNFTVMYNEDEANLTKGNSFKGLR